MPTPDHRTDTELVMAHRQTSDDSAREALILRYSGLAVRSPGASRAAALPYDDIVQSGYLGLIQAVDRYEPSRGVPLQAYAARTIEGEIMHLFRDRGWAVRVPRSLQELSRSIAVVSEQLGHRLGRKPTIAELAEASGTQRGRGQRGAGRPARLRGGAAERAGRFGRARRGRAAGAGADGRGVRLR